MLLARLRFAWRVRASTAERGGIRKQWGWGYISQRSWTCTARLPRPKKEHVDVTQEYFERAASNESIDDESQTSAASNELTDHRPQTSFSPSVSPSGSYDDEQHAKVLCGLLKNNGEDPAPLRVLLQMLSKRKRNTSEQLGQHGHLTLLVTPHHAQCALDSNFPLEVLARLKSEPEDFPSSVKVVVAVVDGLPSPAWEKVTKSYQGMAYLWRPTEQEQGDGDSDVGGKALQSEATKPGSLFFYLSDPHSQSRLPSYSPWHRLQMPLAQTVFSTGLVSTCIRRRYAKSADQNAIDVPSQRLVLKTQEKLESYGVELPMSRIRGDTASSVEFVTPLIPITPLRRVENSMGNIIRKVSADTAHRISRARSEGDESVIETIPASTELEKMVSRYFEHLSLQPETVNVWALIVPEAVAERISFSILSNGSNTHKRHFFELSPETVAEFWPGTPEFTGPKYEKQMTEMFRLVRRGARLCRVLSGGGGWGKKAGLLSLDPDSEYSTRELRQDTGWNFDFDDESDHGVAKQQRQALGDIVREGDATMFFISPSEDHMPDLYKALGSGRENTQETLRRASFGTIPSTMDEIPNSNGSMEGKPHRFKLKHHSDFFGALSEGGMAMTIMGGRQPDSTTAQSHWAKGAEMPITSQSKLDIPFTRFNMDMHTARPPPSASDTSQRHYLRKPSEGDTSELNQRPVSIRKHGAKRTELHSPFFPRTAASRRSFSTSTRLSKRPPNKEERTFIKEQLKEWKARNEATDSNKESKGADVLRHVAITGKAAGSEAARLRKENMNSGLIRKHPCRYGEQEEAQGSRKPSVHQYPPTHTDNVFVVEQTPLRHGKSERPTRNKGAGETLITKYSASEGTQDKRRDNMAPLITKYPASEGYHDKGRDDTTQPRQKRNKTTEFDFKGLDLDLGEFEAFSQSRANYGK